MMMMMMVRILGVESRSGRCPLALNPPLRDGFLNELKGCASVGPGNIDFAAKHWSGTFSPRLSSLMICFPSLSGDYLPLSSSSRVRAGMEISRRKRRKDD
jgi:hypothetical protein